MAEASPRLPGADASLRNRLRNDAASADSPVGAGDSIDPSELGLAECEEVAAGAGEGADDNGGQPVGTDREATELTRAERVIAFIECLKIPSGRDRGKPFLLREWQRDFIRSIYDPVYPDGRRKVRRALLSMARKNGKTAIIAGIVLAHLVGPEASYGQEIYSAANDKEQASIIFRQCCGIIEQDETLTQLVRPIPSRKRLVCEMFGSFYTALSSDAKTKHGLNPAVWVYDELAQAISQDLYEALDTSQGAQAEPLGIVISTQAVSPKSLMSQLVDDAIKIQSGEVVDETRAVAVYAVPRDADPFDESLWPLANPAIGDFLSLEDMRAEAAQAKRLPSRLASFRNLRLNQQVDGTDQLLTAEDWKACAHPVDRAALRGRSCVAGLDLSTRRDLTALELLFDPLPGEELRPVLSFVWTPDANLAGRAQADAAPYLTWREQGHLLTTPGATVDYGFVAVQLAELAAEFNIRGVAFDRWRIGDLINALGAHGVPHTCDPDKPQFGVLRLIPWGQGFKDMAPAVDAIEELATGHVLAHGGHPVLTWAASNAVATRDPANNRKLDKIRARNRIDPFVALTMAAGLAARLGAADSDYVEQGLIDVFAA